MKTLSLSDAVVKNANEIPWHPDYMKNRLIDWTKALDWDWVVSRQRLFAADSGLVLQKAVVKSSYQRKTGYQSTPEWKSPELRNT